MIIFLLLISSCPILEARFLRDSCYYCLFSPPGLTSVLLSTSHLVGVPEQSPCYQNATQSSEIASRRFPHRHGAGVLQETGDHFPNQRNHPFMPQLNYLSAKLQLNI